MTEPVYLDNMATTPVDPQVAECMKHYLTVDGEYANPASQTHVLGRRAEQAVQNARVEVAEAIGASKEEIIWTSGATEANNLAIQGVAYQYQRQGKHIITCLTEHKAVLDVCHHLETCGFEITYLQPQYDGHLTLEQIKESIRSDTILVTLMHVNNEIGVIHDIAAIAELTRRKGILFHVDAAQSLGKLAIDLSQWPVDLMSLSGHKVYGPKGIGCLFVRRQPRVRLVPLSYGGGHEQGLRPGTLATHQIVGMAQAFTQAVRHRQANCSLIATYSQKLQAALEQLPGIHWNGDHKNRVFHNINVSFENVEGESLLYALTDVAVASGSACTSATLEPSHVLQAIGLSDELADAAIRITPGRFNTESEIAYVAEHIPKAVTWLRAIGQGI